MKNKIHNPKLKLLDKLILTIPRLEKISTMSDLIDEVLNEYGTLNIESNEGITPLEAAINSGNIQLCGKLIAHGADPNLIGLNGDMPLITALRKLSPKDEKHDRADYLDMVDFLITKGADINYGGKNYITPLIFCTKEIKIKFHENSQEKSSKILRRLTTKDTINIIDNSGHTALYYTIKNSKFSDQNSKEALCKYLIENGADYSIIAPLGETNIFLLAIKWFTKEMVYWIYNKFEEFIDINDYDNLHKTALMYCLERYEPSLELTNFLIDKGAGKDINIQNLNGDTALICAVKKLTFRYSFERDSGKFISILLDSGADINIKNYKGDTALKFAARNDEYRIGQLLIDHGGDEIEFLLELKKLNKNTSFSRKYLNIFSKIVNDRDLENNNELARAVIKGDTNRAIDIIKVLKADLNMQYQEGKTIFMLSLENRQFKLAYEILETLLENEIDLEDYQSRMGSFQSVKENEKEKDHKNFMANMDIKDNNGDSSLFYIIRNIAYYRENTSEHNLLLKILTLIIEAKININVTNGEKNYKSDIGETVLVSALKLHQYDLVDHILKYQNEEDKINILKDSFFSAIHNNLFDVCDTLLNIEPQLISLKYINPVLSVTILKEYYELAKLLIARGADINDTLEWSKTNENESKFEFLNDSIKIIQIKEEIESQNLKVIGEFFSNLIKACDNKNHKLKIFNLITDKYFLNNIKQKLHLGRTEINFILSFLQEVENNISNIEENLPEPINIIEGQDKNAVSEGILQTDKLQKNCNNLSNNDISNIII